MPEFADLTPRDRHHLALVAHVHPADRVDPQPSGRRSRIEIGACRGRLVTRVPWPGVVHDEPPPAGSRGERA